MQVGPSKFYWSDSKLHWGVPSLYNIYTSTDLSTSSCRYTFYNADLLLNMKSENPFLWLHDYWHKSATNVERYLEKIIVKIYSIQFQTLWSCFVVFDMIVSYIVISNFSCQTKCFSLNISGNGPTIPIEWCFIQWQIMSLYGTQMN